ncbi:MAG: Gfo/Idh/MocA family oxidoreductase [Bacilli bacterium]
MSVKERLVGVIGAGGISVAHLEALADIPEVTVHAIADPIISIAEARAMQFKIPQVFSNYTKILEMPEIESVIICVPNYLHAPISIDALKAGKHVLCEKPMALNSEAAKEMVDIQKQSGKQLMIGLNNRFRGDTQLLKKYIDGNELGKIYHGKTGWIRRRGIPAWGRWFSEKEKSGGGPLIDIGVHMLDLTLWLMGNVKPVSVVGAAYTEFGNRGKGIWPGVTAPDDLVFDVEDLASAFIRLENGATLTLDVSWASHIEKEKNFVQLMGTNGGATLDSDHFHIYSEKYGSIVDLSPKPDKVNDRVELLKHYFTCIDTGETPICSAEQGLFVNKILDAIYQSSQTGQLIEIV